MGVLFDTEKMLTRHTGPKLPVINILSAALPAGPMTAVGFSKIVLLYPISIEMAETVVPATFVKITGRLTESPLLPFPVPMFNKGTKLAV